MQGPVFKKLVAAGRALGILAVIALTLTGAPKRHQYSPHERAFYTDLATVEFVRPGLVITINSAQIAADGTISTVYTVSDPKGLPWTQPGLVHRERLR